jgi:hypothetical protein
MSVFAMWQELQRNPTLRCQTRDKSSERKVDEVERCLAAQGKDDREQGAA